MNHSQHAPIPVDFPVFLKRICENPLTFLIPALRPSGPAAVPEGNPTQLRRSHPKKLHRGAPGMQPRIPIPIPAPGAWRAGGANHPHGHFQPLHSHSRRMEDGITQWDHGILLGVLSSPFRAPPLPSPAGGGRDSLLTLVSAPSPRDDPLGSALCSPCFPPSAFLPDFLLSASPCGRIRPFPSPSTPNPAGKSPAEPRHCGFTPEQPRTPRPSLQARGAPPCRAQPPPEAPQGGEFGGGSSRDPGPFSCSSYLPAPCAAPGEGVAQVRALPFSYLTFPVRLE